VFASLDVYRPDTLTLKGASGAEEASGALVSDGIFRTLGGDTSRNGNLCTFAESRCNVLNRLAGATTNYALSKNGAFSP
jgi:hypothetical protein